MNKQELYQRLVEMYPNAQCELVYHNEFEMLIATILSAQTTDIAVNKITPALFSKFPCAEKLQNAQVNEIYDLIKTIGLANTKAKNIILLSKILSEQYDGKVPNDFDELIKLPGVGRKTANVVLAEVFNVPRIAVDTHVGRVAFRLGLTKSLDPLKVENDLMQQFPKEIWKQLHLELLFFGRYFCKSQNPNCLNCPFKIQCCFKNEK